MHTFIQFSLIFLSIVTSTINEHCMYIVLVLIKQEQKFPLEHKSWLL